VFTFTMGYNVVLSYLLLGVQSEVSWNLSNTRLLGVTSNTANSATTVPSPLPPFLVPGTFSSSSNATSTAGALETNLRNNWTISEMARIGFLIDRALLYGLIGWSMGGFDLGDTPVRPFTLNGLTYGGGVEYDFGWLRAFLQFKGIDYRDKDLIAPGTS